MSNPLAFRIHEWLAVIFLISVIIGLAMITSISKYYTEMRSHEYKAFSQQSIVSYFEVIITGAVKYPGSYRFYSPVSMRDLFEFAQPLQNANLRKFSLDRIISKALLVNVTTQEMINITIQGAVKNSGTIQVPKGSSLEDLLQIIAFDELADTHVLRKKRKLKACEVISIPFCK